MVRSNLGTVAPDQKGRRIVVCPECGGEASVKVGRKSSLFGCPVCGAVMDFDTIISPVAEFFNQVAVA